MDPGSHVDFQISTKNKNLVEDHPMKISGKFGWNLFSGFREEDLNVKKLTDGRTTDAYPWQKLTWSMARWAKKGTGGTYLLVFKILKISGIIYIKNYIKYLKVQTVPHLPLGVSYKSSHNNYSLKTKFEDTK